MKVEWQFTFDKIRNETHPDRTSTLIPTSNCSYDRFNGQRDQTDIINLTQSFVCPITIDFKLMGTVTSNNREFLKL